VPLLVCVRGGLFFHPIDEDLSLGATVKENDPLKLWLRCTPIGEPL
jgi:hypothetical protein